MTNSRRRAVRFCAALSLFCLVGRAALAQDAQYRQDAQYGQDAQDSQYGQGNQYGQDAQDAEDVQGAPDAEDAPGAQVAPDAQDAPGASNTQDAPDASTLQQAAGAVAGRLPSILDAVPANTPVPWQDDGGVLSGSIVPFALTDAGGRLCRALRYTVQGAAQQFAVEGERCRSAGGVWGPGRIADRVWQAPAASPLIRDTQAALKRLLYYDGAVDGVANDALLAAILRFEHDEQVAPDAEPSAGLLELADAAINRIPPSGSCSPVETPPDGWSAACGSGP